MPFTGIYRTLLTSPLVAAGATALTFDPATLLGGVALTNFNLTATSTSAVIGFARSTTSHSSGKYYLEMTCTNDPGGETFGMGVVDSAYTAGVSFIGSDTHSTAYYNTSTRYFGGSSVGQMSGLGYTTGQLIGIAIDLDNRKIWWSRPSVDGFFSPSNLTGDPATNVGGGDISTFATNVYVAVDFEGATGAAFTVNFGPTFALTAPSGFGNW